MIPFPDKKYQIIYADPPWNFKNYKNETATKWVGAHYPVMNIKAIKALPVQDIASENCILFMWATYPFLPRAFEVIKSWGFKYSTVAFTWVKENRKSPGFKVGLILFTTYFFLDRWLRCPLAEFERTCKMCGWDLGEIL